MPVQFHTTMAEIWTNWSGSLKFTPGQLLEPGSEEELSEIVAGAVKNNQKIRLAGAGHSSSPLVHTKDILISLSKFKDVERVDTENSTAWVGTGFTVKEGGVKLLENGLSMHNTGDVDIQCISGAISTGTHGSGVKLKTLSSMLTGFRMVTADGSIREFTEEKDGKDFFDAMRISLGTFGLMTMMRLQLMPKYLLHRTEWCTHTDDCMANLNELIEDNRNFDFYWYPRSDLVKLRILNEPGKGMQYVPYATKTEDYSGWAIDVLPKDRQLKFDEIEYSLPLEAGPDCFLEVRKIIKRKFRRSVAWRLLYRTIAADEYYISPFHGRDSVTISLHQNAGMPFLDYFRTMEPVFKDFGGRPHWGKKHFIGHEDVRKFYPRLDDFLKARAKMDPNGLFLNDHVKKLFDL
jgi:FAD/FMN-containing dehydrogenase